MKYVLLVALLALMPFLLRAESGFEVTDAWARPVAEGMTMGAVFLKAHNGSEQDNAIVSATTPVAETVEIHETKQDEQGRMQMRKMEKLVVSAGGNVELQPGGAHIMLIGVKQPLAAGDEFPVTLTLEDGTSETVTVAVKPLF